MRSEKVYISPIINCILQIQEYTEDLDREAFLENQLIKDAVVRNFEIIGEATKRISGRAKQVRLLQMANPHLSPKGSPPAGGFPLGPGQRER